MEEGFLPGVKMTWALDAPVHVVIGMERSFVTHRLAASDFGRGLPLGGHRHRRRASGASGHRTGSGHLLDWVDQAARARQDRGLAASVKPVVVITVGYPSEVETEKLPASRRKSLDEIVSWL